MRAIGAGQRGLAQEQGRREPLHRAAHHAGGVLGLDFALDHDAKLRDRAGRGERMGDVAERVLDGFEPAIRRDFEPPVDHVLAGVVARREPQRLDHARTRRVVAVERFVRDADAHGQSSNPLANAARRRRTAYIKYCELTAAPSAVLSDTNSVMNSCRPVWKISSIRLFWSRVRMVRAWRWAGPWRP